MVDVFISYSRENQAFVQRLAGAVKALGYSVWWDDDLPPHLSYGDVITREIGEAKAAIVVWSASAAASEWVRAEADLARGQKKLIQTAIDDAMPPMPFNQIQFASLAGWTGEDGHSGWAKVKASLAALCGPAGGTGDTRPTYAMPTTPPPAAPVPAPPPPVGGRRLGLAAGLAALVAVAGGGGYVWWHGHSGAPVANASAGTAPTANAAGGDEAAGESNDLARSAPAPTTADFTQAAVIDDPDGFTNVRSGPAATFPAIARINRGEVFTTYPQTGDWWQVHTASGQVGYMEHSRIRVIQPGAASSPPPAPVAAAPASRPAPPRPQPRPAPPAPQPRQPNGQAQQGNGRLPPQLLQRRRFCMGPGHGTPQCRRFFQMMRERRANGNFGN